MKRVLTAFLLFTLATGGQTGVAEARQGRVVETLPKPTPKPRPAPRPTVSAQTPEPDIAARVEAATDEEAGDQPIRPAGREGVTTGSGASVYATALAGAATCDDFAKIAADATDVRPLISTAAKTTKGEFETSDEFIARYSRGIVTSVGGSNMLVIRLPMPGSSLTYDADRGVFKATTYSLSSAIDSIACESYCALSPVKWDLGSYYTEGLEFSVPREAAVAAKTASNLVLGFPLNRVTIGKASYGERFAVTINARCAVLVSGDTVYPAISSFWFDRSKPRGR